MDSELEVLILIPAYRFTLGCKPSKLELEVTVRKGQQDHIIYKQWRRNLEANDPDSLQHLAAP